MKCISRSPRFHTRALPVLLVVLLLVITAVEAGDVARGRTSGAGLLFLWAFIAFGYLISWLHTFGVADEVWDGGDHLLVKMDGKVDRVSIADVESFSESAMNPHRITLQLARPGRFGRTVVFWPALDASCLIPFVMSRVGRDLAERIDRAPGTES
jgi:hypothetical protein